jgi:hypothetical protein
MKGKFFAQRGTADPATGPAEEGRVFYNETEEVLKVHISSGWDDIITTGNAPGLIGTNFLRKDQADSTPFTLGVLNLQASNNVQGASLTVTGTTATVNGNTIWNEGNDGAGSGLDADRLDAQHGTYYRNAGNMNAGTLPVARLSGTYNINISGTADHAKYS